MSVKHRGHRFGPSKYGLLPEPLPEKSLSWGNGVIELGTFLAIILGTVGGAWMGEHFTGHELYAGYVLLGLSVIGFGTSLGIDKVRAAAPEKPFRFIIVGDLWTQIGKMRQDRPLFLAVLGNTYFSFLGSLLFSTIVVYGPDVLHVGQTKTGYLNATVAVGIGLGSMAAGWISENKIEYGLIPLGSIGMTCTGFALGIVPHGMTGSAVLLGVLGFWAGFFAVPVNALIQHKPAEQDRSGIIAAANLLSFVGIAISSGVYFLFTAYIHLDPRGVIVAASCITALSTAYVLYLLPEWFGRLILFFVTRTVYRVRVIGRDNFPEKTGALLVCNHMSFVDVALLVAATDRPIRFIMYRGLYDHPLVKPFAKMVKAIPISSEQHPREMLHSLRTATDALKNDEIVCIFAEGQITRTGQLLPFRRGLERIMKGVEVPIVPVNLDGVWGSIFSFERGRFLWKMPRHIPYRVTVSFGNPMPPTSTAIEVRAAVQELHAAAFEMRKPHMKTPDRAFVRAARLRPFQFFMADGKTESVSFGSALSKTVYIARRFRRHVGDQPMIGVLLPPSVGGALTNYALMPMGRVLVNLNYTSSNETIASCASQCGVDLVITSKAFLERFPNMTIPGRTLLLEDALADPRFSGKLTALATTGPSGARDRRCMRLWIRWDICWPCMLLQQTSRIAHKWRSWLKQYRRLLVAVFFTLARVFGRVHSDQDPTTILAVIAGIAAAVSLPSAITAFWRLVRHGTPERSMKQIGTAVLEALTLEGSLNAQSEFQINAERNRDGSVYCWLTGGTGRDQSIFIRAMREVLRPIENPRYLLAQNLYWRFFRENYFSVPEVFGRKKEFAEAFAKKWRSRVGPVQLVYTRSPEGRRVLLRARMHSLSASFQQRAERMSCWK